MCGVSDLKVFRMYSSLTVSKTKKKKKHFLIVSNLVTILLLSYCYLIPILLISYWYLMVILLLPVTISLLTFFTVFCGNNALNGCQAGLI